MCASIVFTLLDLTPPPPARRRRHRVCLQIVPDSTPVQDAFLVADDILRQVWKPDDSVCVYVWTPQLFHVDIFSTLERLRII